MFKLIRISQPISRYYHSNSALNNLKKNANRIALVDHSKSYKYQDLDKESDKISVAIQKQIKNNSRICILTPNNGSYVSSLLGVWKSGNVALPLCKSHPAKTLEYYVQDSDSDLIIVSESLIEKGHHLSKCCHKKLVILEEIQESSNVDEAPKEPKNEEDALILYTSGTTGAPKGVVLTHSNLNSQMSCMIQPWGWNCSDSILHVLPLHHTHGIVNCLLTPLSVGAKIVMRPEFNAKDVWSHFLMTKTNQFNQLSPLPDNEITNVFMAVPTVYAKLIEAYSQLFTNKEEMNCIKQTLVDKYRLMVSGSASLPQPILEKFREISGHTLLERYGMTEIGMALTNPLKPESHRKPGYVGKPFPGVHCRIIQKESNESRVVLAESDSESFKIFSKSNDEAYKGELEVRGANVFKEYFRKPSETAKEFTDDGWFKTGDTASISKLDGTFKILGRSSVDIIKSGGYKISALDIERILLGHPLIRDVAVVGVEDNTWGQIIGAIIVMEKGLANEKDLTIDELKNWSQDKMPKYQIPRVIKILNELPRNAMGKVNKKDLVKNIDFTK